MKKNRRYINREKILERDGYICGYCFERRATQVDHIVPVAYREITSEDNLIACCSDCNHIAGSMVFDNIQAKREYIQGVLKTRKWIKRRAGYLGEEIPLLHNRDDEPREPVIKRVHRVFIPKKVKDPPSHSKRIPAGDRDVQRGGVRQAPFISQDQPPKEKRAMKKRPDTHCAYCGRVISPGRSGQRIYCSKACKQQSYRDRKEAGQNKREIFIPPLLPVSSEQAYWTRTKMIYLAYILGLSNLEQLAARLGDKKKRAWTGQFILDILYHHRTIDHVTMDAVEKLELSVLGMHQDIP